MIPEKKCDYCGKIFVPTHEYAWKLNVGNRTEWFCKYTCFLRGRERKNEKVKSKKRGIERE